jgi:hypothetical protein
MKKFALFAMLLTAGILNFGCAKENPPAKPGETPAAEKSTEKPAEKPAEMPAEKPK